jgi:xanthine dehydrogenase accessory protein XdhC
MSSANHLQGAHRRTLPQSRVGQWLEPLAGNWAEAAIGRLVRHPAVVRILVVTLRGSAPREAGACMLVDAGGMVGTIGGGRLEWQAVAEAEALLRDRQGSDLRTMDLILGPQLGQCCGGRVELRLERFRRADGARLQEYAREEHDAQLRRRAALWIYGAGHVGQALVRILMHLDLFQITWIDPRSELLPADLPDSVTARLSSAPLDTLAAAPAACSFIVLTHDHALDYALCRAILTRRGDTPDSWLGLIGSASKAARFRARLIRDGLDRSRLAALHCPIGLGGTTKLPAAIAIAVAAQLMQLHAASTSRSTALIAKPVDCGSNCADCAKPQAGAP